MMMKMMAMEVMPMLDERFDLVATATRATSHTAPTIATTTTATTTTEVESLGF
jgi:hypothetical protein